MAAAAAAAGGGDEEMQREAPLAHVLALPVALPLPDAVSRMDAGVPRKARTVRPRAVPSGWWAFRLPVPPPPARKARLPAAPRLRACSAPDLGAAAAPAVEKPAKKARRCLQCGSADTPQWRSGPMGRSTLCNACGVRLRAAGALRETEPSPPAATVKKAAETPPPPPLPPPESPASESSPDSPIWERRAPPGEVYLVRKPPQRERRTPRKEASPASSPAIYLVKKKKPSKKPWRPRNTGQSCQHCGTTSTPQWREGPMGRHTLCNACGVRYRQGRLLPEYRPAASPTFVPSEHANRHSEVLQLHRQQQTKKQQHPNQLQLLADGNSSSSADAPGSDIDDKYNVFLVRRELPVKEYPPTPLHRPLPQPMDDDDPRAGGNKDSATGTAPGCGGGEDATDAPSDLESRLLDGPSAPLIIDSDEFLVR